MSLINIPLLLVAVYFQVDTKVISDEAQISHALLCNAKKYEIYMSKCDKNMLGY